MKISLNTVTLTHPIPHSGRRGDMRRVAYICVILCMVSIPVMAGITAADSVAKYMAIGDKLAGKWDHMGAAFAYETVLKYDPNHYEASWKAGDERTEWADQLTGVPKKVIESHFMKAAAFCEKAIEINPEGWEGHFRLSVALGRLALFKGGKEKIRLSRQIKDEADKAVELNPDADLAYHVLGRWHQNLANLSGVLKFFAKVLYGGVPPGSNEEAVEMFTKAIELGPEHIEHHLELARTYEFMGQKDLMTEPLKKVLELPNKEEDDPSFKKEAETMLKKLK